MVNKALHYSAGKLGIGQIPAEVLAVLAEVYSYGEGKYGRDNWKDGTDWSEFLTSAKRHMLFWEAGEHCDPESTLEHLAHAIWNLTTLLYYEWHGMGNDDRPEEFASRLRTDMEEIANAVQAFKQKQEETNG